MDEIEQRLKDSTAECIKCYEAWSKDKKGEDARENLAEAIHELRKVTSRLEIEMAASEREQMAGRPISIPPHRSQRKVQPGGNDMPFSGDDEGDDDDVGNAMPDSNEGNGLQPRRSGGGGGKRPQQNRGRRPNPNRGNE